VWSFNSHYVLSKHEALYIAAIKNHVKIPANIVELETYTTEKLIKHIFMHDNLYMYKIVSTYRSGELGPQDLEGAIFYKAHKLINYIMESRGWNSSNVIGILNGRTDLVFEKSVAEIDIFSTLYLAISCDNFEVFSHLCRIYSDYIKGPDAEFIIYFAPIKYARFIIYELKYFGVDFNKDYLFGNSLVDIKDISGIKEYLYCVKELNISKPYIINNTVLQLLYHDRTDILDLFNEHKLINYGTYNNPDCISVSGPASLQWLCNRNLLHLTLKNLNLCVMNVKLSFLESIKSKFPKNYLLADVMREFEHFRQLYRKKGSIPVSFNGEVSVYSLDYDIKHLIVIKGRRLVLPRLYTRVYKSSSIIEDVIILNIVKVGLFECDDIKGHLVPRPAAMEIIQDDNVKKTIIREILSFIMN
jgi:hypothetical protein